MEAGRGIPDFRGRLNRSDIRRRSHKSPERLIDRWTLFGKKLRAVLSDVKTIFQTNSKLTIDRDRRFVAETHARLNRSFVAPDEVGPFVSVEPDAVTRAMRQARHSVIGTKAGVSDHLACGSVNRFT